jgi:hypothetical protein
MEKLKNLVKMINRRDFVITYFGQGSSRGLTLSNSAKPWYKGQAIAQKAIPKSIGHLVNPFITASGLPTGFFSGLLPK